MYPAGGGGWKSKKLCFTQSQNSPLKNKKLQEVVFTKAEEQSQNYSNSKSITKEENVTQKHQDIKQNLILAILHASIIHLKQNNLMSLGSLGKKYSVMFGERDLQSKDLNINSNEKIDQNQENDCSIKKIYSKGILPSMPSRIKLSQNKINSRNKSLLRIGNTMKIRNCMSEGTPQCCTKDSKKKDQMIVCNNSTHFMDVVKSFRSPSPQCETKVSNYGNRVSRGKS